MTTETKFPTETIELPSKGKLYAKDSALASGTVEMRYMTAADEDLLTNPSYIEKGVVIDKLLQSLIVDKSINYSDLLIGDKNALVVAARILGYGKMYPIEYAGREVIVDLTEIEDKPLHEVVEKATENKFKYTLPVSGTVVTFKLLTHGDEQLIEQEMKGMRKLGKEVLPELTTRMKYMILAVDDNEDRKVCRDFADNMLARDAREFRKYVAEIQPDIDMRFYPVDGPANGVNIPINIQFFYPDFEA